MMLFIGGGSWLNKKNKRKEEQKKGLSWFGWFTNITYVCWILKKLWIIIVLSMIFQLNCNPWRGSLTITSATIIHILWPTPKVVVVASIPQTWSYELTFCKCLSSLMFLANKLKIIMEGGKVHVTSKVAKEFCMQQFDYTNYLLTIMPRPSNPSQGLIHSFNPNCFKMHAMMGLVSSSGIMKNYSCRHLYMDSSVKFLVIFWILPKSFSQC